MGLKPVQTDRADVQQVWEAAEAETREIRSSWLLQGKTMEVTLASGSNTIKHGLGRVATGYVVLWQDAAVNLTATDLNRKLWTSSDLVITSSGAATVKLWVV